MILAQATIMAGSASGSDIKASIPGVGTDYAGISGNIDFDDHGNTPGMMADLFDSKLTAVEQKLMLATKKWDSGVQRWDFSTM